MRTVLKAILALSLLLNVGAFARQTTSFLPDSALTPGDMFDVTIEDICTPGYAKKVRAVTKPPRDQAFKSYGVLARQRLDPFGPRGFEFHQESVATAKQYVAVERAG